MQNNTDKFNPEDMYHMFDLKPLEKDIWYFKNVVSYPEELLNFINDIDLDSQSHYAITKWEPWTASDDSSFVYGKNKYILPNNLVNKTNNPKLNQKILYINNSFEMAFNMCLNQYLSHRGLDRSMYSLPMQQVPLRKWTSGSGMGPHCDSYDGDTDLAFSMIIYLNDDYEGGEINFPNHGVSVKPEPGSLIIFPSQEPYLHAVKKVISGERYTSHLSVYKI
jgi:hypothetical protein